MNLKDILPALEKVAPTIAGLAGGPIAGIGVQALEGVFGIAPGTTSTNPAPVVAAVAGMSPDQAVALAKVDAELKGKLADAGISYETIAAGDRASARGREVAVKDWAPKVLAIVITAGFFGLLLLLAFHDVPAPSRDLLNIMCGSLGAGWLAVVTYYYGSSAGSAKKDDTIKALAS
jgi:hypothetical protein